MSYPSKENNYQGFELYVKNPGDVVADTEGFYLMRGHPGHTLAVPKVGWDFNGDLVKPTFTPSILESPRSKLGHHYIITDGVVHYLKDDRILKCCEEHPEEYWVIPAWDSEGTPNGV